MKLNNLLTGKRKNLLIGLCMLISFFILLPNFIKVINYQMAPYSENEVVITTVNYESEIDGEENLIVGNLFQPSPKHGDKKYPAIIACHGFLTGMGKESMQRWCVELAKRDFVVLAIDLPGRGMSVGEMDLLPRKDIEPHIIKDGIKYLKDLDFVEDSEIGLIGISYGGSTVSICSGVLGELIDATVSLNAFTNFTNWLIEGILPDADVEFTVKRDYIEIEKIGDREVSSRNIKEFLKLYGIFRGDDENIEDLIISGTRRLDREFLKKFDAVEYLPTAKDDSVLFIHSEHDKTFDKTNQSGQGYMALINAGKRAHYILVDDNHMLTDDSEYISDYCIINFFEEKLKNVDLGPDWNNDYDKYSQPNDIELTYAPVFSWSMFQETFFYFFLSLIPFFIIISIIFYNKKIAKKRAIQEEIILNKKQSDKSFIDFSLGRGSYYKTVLFLIFSYVIGFTAIVGMSLGFFSELIVGTLCAMFYLSLYLMLYYLPDQAEVDLWERMKGKNKRNNSKSDMNNSKTRKFNKLAIIIALFAIVIVSSFIGFMLTFMPKYFYQPLEQIMTPMLIIGSIFIISGILLIYFVEKKESPLAKINWGRYSLDKYQILKSLTFGSVIFLNILVQWDIMAFYMKFPVMIGPHSIYFLYAALAFVLFFAGIHIFIKILKEKVLKEKLRVSKAESQLKKLGLNILIEALAIILGLIMISLIVFISYSALLNTKLFGNFTYQLLMYLGFIFLIAYIIYLISVDRGIFGVQIFIPLTCFALIAFVLHI